MKKDVGIYIRISLQQKEKLDNLGIGPTEIFKIGYEKIMENYDKEFDEIVKNRYNEYIRVYTIQQKNKQKELEKQMKTKKDEIDSFKQKYEFFINEIKNWSTMNKALYIKQRLPNTDKVNKLSDEELFKIKDRVLKDNFSFEDFKEIVEK